MSTLASRPISHLRSTTTRSTAHTSSCCSSDRVAPTPVDRLYITRCSSSSSTSCTSIAPKGLPSFASSLLCIVEVVERELFVCRDWAEGEEGYDRLKSGGVLFCA